MATEREKMAAGEWYSCLDDELELLRDMARGAVHAHNTLPPTDRGTIAAPLRALLGEVAEDVLIEAPFHCAYGMNLRLGAGVYLNAGCVILDTAPVTLGAGALLGPGVHVYCADHHRDPARRAEGHERALPVTIGANAWIGGAAVILPGVTVGEGAIVGAGSVVTRDVPPGSTVAGNPARPVQR